MSMLRRPGIGSFGGGDDDGDAMAGGGFGAVRVTAHFLVVVERTLTAGGFLPLYKPLPLQWILTPVAFPRTGSCACVPTDSDADAPTLPRI